MKIKMVNEQTLVGNLGKDPVMKTTPSGMNITEFSVATTDRVKKHDVWEKVTDWHFIKCFGKTAENAARYLKKGSKVYIKGKTKHEQWENDGHTHNKTVVLVNDIQYLDSRPQNTQQQGFAQPQAPQQQAPQQPIQQQYQQPVQQAQYVPPPPQGQQKEDDLPF